MGCQFCLGVSPGQKPSSGKLSWRIKWWSLQSAGRPEGLEGIRKEKQLTTGEKARKRSTYEYDNRATVVTRQVTQRKQGLYRRMGMPIVLSFAKHNTATREPLRRIFRVIPQTRSRYRQMLLPYFPPLFLIRQRSFPV